MHTQQKHTVTQKSMAMMKKKNYYCALNATSWLKLQIEQQQWQLTKKKHSLMFGSYVWVRHPVCLYTIFNSFYLFFYFLFFWFIQFHLIWVNKSVCNATFLYSGNEQVSVCVCVYSVSNTECMEQMHWCCVYRLHWFDHMVSCLTTVASIQQFNALDEGETENTQFRGIVHSITHIVHCSLFTYCKLCNIIVIRYCCCCSFSFIRYEFGALSKFCIRLLIFHVIRL